MNDLFFTELTREENYVLNKFTSGTNAPMLYHPEVKLILDKVYAETSTHHSDKKRLARTTCVIYDSSMLWGLANFIRYDLIVAFNRCDFALNEEQLEALVGNPYMETVDGILFLMRSPHLYEEHAQQHLPSVIRAIDPKVRDEALQIVLSNEEDFEDNIVSMFFDLARECNGIDAEVPDSWVRKVLAF